MEDHLARYHDIMRDYRSGRFGSEHLTLRNILEKAGEPDLLNKMTPDEIQSLLDSATGMTRLLFSQLKAKKLLDAGEQAC